MSDSSSLYRSFTAVEFVLDENFVRWVKSPSRDDLEFWAQWLAGNPEKMEVIKDARHLVTHLAFEKDFNSSENIDQTWDVLATHFDNSQKTAGFVVRFFSTYQRLAAVIGLLGLLGTFLWFWVNGQTTAAHYKTGYGEVSRIVLTDSTEVILNANSTLKVEMVSGLRPRRETWLTGEAFFKVKRHKKPQTFTVHTSNVHVTVLGTQFNVFNRRHESTVVLRSGKVKINNSLGWDNELIMKPGEMTFFSDTSKIFIVKSVNPENHLSWTQQKLIFEHTPITDVAHVLEDTYGLSVVISKATLANKTFTATLPTNNLPILLRAIEESFNVNITQTDQKLFITDK